MHICTRSSTLHDVFEQTKLEVESRFNKTAEALRPGAENAALKRTTISTTLVVAKHCGLKPPRKTSFLCGGGAGQAERSSERQYLNVNACVHY